MIAALFMLASSATPHAATFPPQLIGRWEMQPQDCKIAIALRDLDGFVVVKPDKLEYYEAEAKLLSLRVLDKNAFQADVKISEDGEYYHEKTKLRLVAPDRLVFLTGALHGTYLRCRKSK